MEKILMSPEWHDQVLYQPRTWFNAYQLNSTAFEGNPGALLVHFHDLDGGDKWSSMATYFDQIALRNSTWSLPLGLTTYESEVREYWDRVRKAGILLQRAEAMNGKDGVVDHAAKRLEHAVRYEADVETEMHGASDALKEALGVREGEKVV